MNTIEEIAGLLKGLKSAVIFTHTRPDGDAIGSSMALSRALSLCNIQNQVIDDSEIPEKFSAFHLRIQKFPTLDAECYICVDASDDARLGDLAGTFRKGAKKGKLTVNIDHHISNTRFCKYNYVRERASNSENILELIRALGVPLDRQISEYLMMGIVTDSGGFSHSDVGGDTFRAAALLADGGADVCAITYEIFRKQSKARAGMYAETISHLRYLLNDRLAVALVTQEMLSRYGLGQDSTEGIVDFGLTVDSVEVSVCLLESKRGQYKASFRSKGKVNVNEVAGVFGGGGHVLASGCMFFGELEEVIDKLRYAVLQHMGE